MVFSVAPKSRPGEPGRRVGPNGRNDGTCYSYSRILVGSKERRRLQEKVCLFRAYIRLDLLSITRARPLAAKSVT